MALISNERPAKDRRHGVGAEVEGQPRQLTGEHTGHACVHMCKQASEAQVEQGTPQPRGVVPWSWEPAKDKL